MFNKKYRDQFPQKKFLPTELLSHFPEYRPFTKLSKSYIWSEIEKLQAAKEKAIR